LAGGYGPDCVRVRQDLAIAESQLRDYQARLGKPFTHDAYLSELTNLRDQLKAGLSATAPALDDETGPRVSDLAEKIKALKAAHSIEATPHRVGQKHSTAEEPVTARIRRRGQSDPASESDSKSGPAEVLEPESPQNLSSKPPAMFHDRIAIERLRKDQEPSLS
jgi:hypothetical protein